MTTSNEAFFNGYQEALSDLSNALRNGGVERLLEWARDNSRRGQEFPEQPEPVTSAKIERNSEAWNTLADALTIVALDAVSIDLRPGGIAVKSDGRTWSPTLRIGRCGCAAGALGNSWHTPGCPAR